MVIDPVEGINGAFRVYGTPHYRMNLSWSDCWQYLYPNFILIVSKSKLDTHCITLICSIEFLSYACHGHQISIAFPCFSIECSWKIGFPASKKWWSFLRWQEEVDANNAAFCQRWPECSAGDFKAGRGRRWTAAWRAGMICRSWEKHDLDDDFSDFWTILLGIFWSHLLCNSNEGSAWLELLPHLSSLSPCTWRYDYHTSYVYTIIYIYKYTYHDQTLLWLWLHLCHCYHQYITNI